MPDTEEVKKTVELDTSGPAMDVDVPETKEEDIVEQKEAPVEESTVRPVVEEKQSEYSFNSVSSFFSSNLVSLSFS